MSRDVRSRLAAQAAAAGYPPDLLALIAHATLPRRPARTAARRLADRADHRRRRGPRPSRLPGRTLAEHVADYQRRHGEDWRERFWTRALRIATIRYRRPDSYGLSPCETDPHRLARHAARQPAPASAARAA